MDTFARYILRGFDAIVEEWIHERIGPQLGLPLFLLERPSFPQSYTILCLSFLFSHTYWHT